MITFYFFLGLSLQETLMPLCNVDYLVTLIISSINIAFWGLQVENTALVQEQLNQ